jgi:rhodanese-related sulfurtransferase
VRTPAEITLIGYATPTAAHIPAQFLPTEPEFSAKGSYKMIDNPGFVEEFNAWLASDAARGIDTVLVTCRSGGRSAEAIARLVEAGVTVDLYNIVDGFEGDKGESGARDVNGWRNAGLPWTYTIREGLRPGHN